IEIGLARQVDGKVEEGAGRGELDPIRSEGFAGAPEVGGDALEIAPPDVATVDGPERERQALGNPGQDRVELIEPASHQVDVEDVDRQRQGGVGGGSEVSEV